MQKNSRIKANSPFRNDISVSLRTGRHPVRAALFQFHTRALFAMARIRRLNVLFGTPRGLNPRRLGIILDLELV